MTTKTKPAEDLTTQLTTVLDELSTSVAPKDLDTLSPLRRAWHYLQVYATWGTKLPAEEAVLKMQLDIKDPGAYDFFIPMVDAYGKLSKACQHFLEKVFGGVVSVGNNVEQFAKDASDDDGQMFGVIAELLDSEDADSTDAVVELLQKLQQQAEANATQAGEVTDSLGKFKAQLTDALGDLENIQTTIDNDSRTSQATIDKLSGGDDVAGSLRQMRKKLEADRDEYDHDVVVASTTVTYAWVFPPAGLIAAATVAGVYGKRATDMLAQIDREEEALSKAESELKLAVQAHKVQDSATASLKQADSYTKDAIIYTTTVQNAWNGIAKNLQDVSTKVRMMTTETDAGVVAASRTVLKVFAKNAGKSWAELLPPLRALCADPYITVQNGEVSWGEFRQQVETALASQEDNKG